MSVYILCGARKALYKIPQKTGTELPCTLCLGKLLNKNVLYFFCTFFSRSVDAGGPISRLPQDSLKYYEAAVPITIAQLMVSKRAEISISRI